MRITRIVPIAFVFLAAPAGMVRADGQVQVSVRADIDLIDAASVVAFSARIGDIEIKARTGWAGMNMDQRQVFVQSHPNCPGAIINKDWGAMTVVERAEILRSQAETRQALLERWDRTTYEEHEAFFQKHPEARRRLETVHGRGWHGGKHGRGKPEARGNEGANDGRRGQGDDKGGVRGQSDAKQDKDGDSDEGKGNGNGHGRGKGKGHKHED